MASKEFTAKNHLGQETKYTPQRVTYNGTQGHFWAQRTLQQNCWVFQGKAFHPLKATRKDIAGE